MANDTKNPAALAPDGTRDLIEFLKDHHGIGTLRVGEVDGRPVDVLMRPHGVSVESIRAHLDAYRKAPEARTGIANLATLQSLIDHANRFKDGGSAIFADIVGGAPKLISVLDYHGGTPQTQDERNLIAGGSKEIGPRFGRHRGVYAFPFSDEWVTWSGLLEDDGPMSQRDFAEFLEANVHNVLALEEVGDGIKQIAAEVGLVLAGPQRLYELSRGLSLKVDTRVVNVTNLASGEGQINWQQEHQDTGGAPLKIPTAFAIAIPVFRAGASYKIAVRLRYRTQGASIVWTLAPLRMDEVKLHALTEAAHEARDKTGLPLFFGTPEA